MFFKTVHLRLEGNIKGLKLSVFFFRVAIRIIVLTISFNINKWEEGLLKTGVLLTFIT